MNDWVHLLGNAGNLQTETTNVLSDTEALAAVTVNAEMLIQQAVAIKANADDLASRVGIFKEFTVNRRSLVVLVFGS